MKIYIQYYSSVFKLQLCFLKRSFFFSFCFFLLKYWKEKECTLVKKLIICQKLFENSLLLSKLATIPDSFGVGMEVTEKFFLKSRGKMEQNIFIHVQRGERTV